MTTVTRPRTRAADAAALAAITDFQSDTAEIIAEKVPLVTRITLHVVALMVATAIALAAVVPVERVVRARGRIVSTAPTIVVQPLELATVRSILVRDGEMVRKGQLLAALDPTFQAADVQRLFQERAHLSAEVSRLEAELAGTAYAPATDDAWAKVQRALYDARAAEYRAALARYDEKLAAIERSIAKTEKELGYYRERLVLFNEVEAMRTTLEEKKVGSRLQSLIATDSRLEMERNVADAAGVIEASRHEMESLRSERVVYEKGRIAEIARDLADKRIALDRATEESAKAARRRDLVELRAVEDAVVLQVGTFSVGSVVQPAEKLITMMPLGTTLEIDANLAADDQGVVRVGDEVAVKFDAWSFAEHGSARGIVRSISADSFTPKEGDGRSFFLAKIDIVDETLRDVPADFRLVPGMPLTADIDVGTHTLLRAIVGGTFKTLDGGFSEP